MPTNQAMTNAWTLQSTNSALGGRLHDGAFLTPTTSGPMVWRDGVLPSTTSSSVLQDLLVAADSPTASMAVRVFPGQCVINRSGQGPYVCSLNATVKPVLNAADTTNPRIDCIVARLYDSVIGDSQTGPWIEVVTGSPASTPVAPSIPTGSIKLAEIAVAANATQIIAANITDKRTGSSTRNSIRVLLPGDDSAAVGSYIGEYTDYNSQLRRWNGTTWDVLKIAGPIESIQVLLKRSDNTNSMNTGNTDLGVYSATNVVGSWSTAYAGRGISLAKPGRYRITGAIYPAPGDSNAFRFISLSVVSATPSVTQILGVGTGTGFDCASGSTEIMVPNGSTFGVTFQCNNNKSAGTLDAGGTPYAIVTRIGEA